MSYLFLAVVLASGVTKGYCGKKTSGYADHFYDAAYINAVRFIICAVIGAGLCLANGGISGFSPVGIHIAVFSGFAQAGFVVTWLLSARTGAVTMLDAFLTLGILIPTVLCRIFFDENILLVQWIGFAVLIAAVCIMCSYNNRIKSKMTAKSFAILLASGIFSGFSDFTQKMYVRLYPEASAATFNFYSYVFATVVLFAVFFFIKPKNAKVISVKKFGGYIIVMAVCLFLNSYFKTLAGKELPAIIMFPVCQGCGMILSAAMAAVFFKEPITKRCVLGMSMTFAALMIITFAKNITNILVRV